MRLALPIGVILAVVTLGAVAVAVWASAADAPWESEDSERDASLLCEDALDRRKATEDALQRPVSLAHPIYRNAFTSETVGVGKDEGPLSAFRDNPRFSDEVTRLESELREIEGDIESSCH